MTVPTPTTPIVVPFPTMTIAGLPVESASDSVSRFSLLLWGPSGAGKTTFACTAPGRKLLINFDPDGFKSVAYREDVQVLDLSEQSHAVLKQLTGDNPLGLDKVLHEFDTVILDSVTSLSQLALERGVALAAANAKGGGPTLEFPGLQGYGARTTVTIAALKALLRVTGRLNKHFIAITHEDDPTVNAEGHVMYITMMLGGKIKNNVALQVSEIWHMDAAESSKGNVERRILIRPARGLRPAKTRMFKSDGGPEIVHTYNADKPDAVQRDTLTHWWDLWVANGKKKLPLPNSKEFAELTASLKQR